MSQSLLCKAFKSTGYANTVVNLYELTSANAKLLTTKITCRKKLVSNTYLSQCEL